MRCIVRRRKTDIEVPDIDIFIPRGMTAEDLLRQMWEKEMAILGADDEIDEDSSICGKGIAVVETVNGNWTEFHVRTVVEVSE